MERVEALNALIFDQKDRLLFLKRASSRTYYPRRWDLLGDGLSLGEDPEEVLLREAQKKLGVNIIARAYLGELSTTNEDICYARHLFICLTDTNRPKIDPDKYSQFEWVVPIETKKKRLTPDLADFLPLIGF
jgi:8-oxo-dGTP diphosphatase